MTAFSSIAIVPVHGELPGYGLWQAIALDFGPEPARADATPHGAYKLFIKGKRVSDQRLTPASASYSTTLQMHPYGATADSHPRTNPISTAIRGARYRHRFHGAEDQIEAILAAAVAFSSRMLAQP